MKNILTGVPALPRQRVDIYLCKDIEKCQLLKLCFQMQIGFQQVFACSLQFGITFTPVEVMVVFNTMKMIYKSLIEFVPN